jgi:hypothetical protein
MSYATGKRPCEDESVQDRKDPYFHAISLKEINSFITNTNPNMGDSCPRRVGTTNFNSPIVVSPGNYVVPKKTPFTLSIKTSHDNDGDALIYNWEEFDKADDPDPPDPAGPFEHEKIRPIFRSLRSTGRSRTFPGLIDLLNKPPVGTYTAESLPMNNRTMIFRATARDTRGRYGYDDSQILVIDTGPVQRMTPRGPVTAVEHFGPFVVREPSQAASWPRLSPHTVTWDPANTTLAPVSCQRVTISLLMRGNENNPIILAANVPNNGSATVVIPANIPLGDARVKVAADGNIFFNLADVDVQIVRQSN